MSRLGLETIILTEPSGYRLGANPFRITIREGVFQDVIISNTLNGIPIADIFPVSGNITTTDATPTTLVSATMALNSAKLVMAEIIGVSTATGDTASFTLSCKAKNIAGVVTVSAPFDSMQILDATLATTSATFIVVGSAITIQMIGVAATTISWNGALRTRTAVF